MSDHRTRPKVAYLLALSNQVTTCHRHFRQALYTLEGQLTNERYQHNADLADLASERAQAQQWKGLTPGSSESQMAQIEQEVASERERFEAFQKGITAKMAEVKCKIDVLETVMSEAARSAEGDGVVFDKDDAEGEVVMRALCEVVGLDGPDTDWEFVAMRPAA